MAGDLRRWWVHTLTDHLPFSFQAKIFIAGNKQGVVRGFEIQGGSGRRNCNIPVLGGCHLPLPEIQWPGCLHLSPGVTFSSAPGGQLFSQEPGQALSIVSETIALTYTLLARLTTFYLKLKFCNPWVPYQLLVIFVALQSSHPIEGKVSTESGVADLEGQFPRQPSLLTPVASSRGSEECSQVW